MSSMTQSTARKTTGERSASVPRVFVAVMVAALAGAVWWAFDFRTMALASRFDPDCPQTGCYAPFGPVGAPIVAVGGLLLGSVLAGICLRYRRPYHLVWLFWLTVVQWVAVIVVGAGSLVD